MNSTFNIEEYFMTMFCYEHDIILSRVFLSELVGLQLKKVTACQKVINSQK